MHPMCLQPESKQARARVHLPARGLLHLPLGNAEVWIWSGKNPGKDRVQV